jgi:geranylgeranyl diphosphate synthase type I
MSEPGLSPVEFTVNAEARRRPTPRDARLEAVEALMRQLAAGDRFERLGAIVQEHLFTGGKRLRARVALESVAALGGSVDAGIAWAAACELLHNATLVHDDLQDGDSIRRGHFTVWVRHGRAQAVNAGDLMLMLPFVAVEHVPVEDGVRYQLCRAVARRAEQTVRGQSMEMGLLSGGQWTWDEYAEAASGKTSALMVLPVHGAALVAGCDPDWASELAEPFRSIGLLFQIQDDVIDLFGDKGRGDRGGDLREGRVSALVAEHIHRHPEEQRWLVDVLSKPRADTSDADVDEAARRFEEGGTLAGVLDRIESLRRDILQSEPLRREPRMRPVAKTLIDLSLRPLHHLLGGHRV